MRESSHAGASKEHGEDQAMQEAWEGRGPDKRRCDLAWGFKCGSKNMHQKDMF